MICPVCGSRNVKVTDSRYRHTVSAVYRRRLCQCGEKFTTYEVVVSEEEVDKYLSVMWRKPCKEVGEWRLKFVEF